MNTATKYHTSSQHMHTMPLGLFHHQAADNIDPLYFHLHHRKNPMYTQFSHKLQDLPSLPPSSPHPAFQKHIHCKLWGKYLAEIHATVLQV